MLTGSIDLNQLIDGYKKEITYIYGEHATGKTTLCLMAAYNAAKQDKKVVYIDTESGFVVDRLQQIAGYNYINILDKILLLKINNFEDQCQKMEMIRRLINIDLIVIDTIGSYYRKVLRDSPKEINRAMDRQLQILKKVSKTTPILMANQVYTNIDTNEITPVGGEMIKKHCDKILQIENNPRKIILKKPEKKQMLFKIENRGISKVTF